MRSTNSRLGKRWQELSADGFHCGGPARSASTGFPKGRAFTAWTACAAGIEFRRSAAGLAAGEPTPELPPRVREYIEERGLYGARQREALLLRRDAVLIESLGQELGDFRRIAAFNLIAMQHEHRLSVAKQRHGRRRRRNSRQQFANPGDGFQIRAGKYGSTVSGRLGCCRAMPTAGRALPAAQPQTELMIISTVPLLVEQRGRLLPAFALLERHTASDLGAWAQ